MVDAAGPLRAGGADRRAHRLGAERRLAGRGAERRRRRRGDAAPRRGGGAGSDRAPRQLGRRGGRALWPLALRLERRRRLDGRPGGAACADGRRRERAARRPRRARRRPRQGARRAAKLENAAAYLELHIEQGPVLESLDLPLGVVLGTFGVERHQITFRGQAAHAGSTPMDARRDALAGAAKLELEIREIAKRTGGGAVCTMGSVVTKPGIVTSVVETAECLLDQRNLDAATLASMLDEAKSASERIAEEEDIEVEWERIWQIEPILFDDAPDRARRRVDPGGRRHVAPPPERAAARRGRGLARGCAHGDALRPEPARPLAHEARGHEGGAPRARRPGARPPRRPRDRRARRPEQARRAARRIRAAKAIGTEGAGEAARGHADVGHVDASLVERRSDSSAPGQSRRDKPLPAAGPTQSPRRRRRLEGEREEPSFADCRPGETHEADAGTSSL